MGGMKPTMYPLALEPLEPVYMGGGGGDKMKLKVWVWT
jgi:hypothetical protein